MREAEREYRGILRAKTSTATITASMNLSNSYSIPPPGLIKVSQENPKESFISSGPRQLWVQLLSLLSLLTGTHTHTHTHTPHKTFQVTAETVLGHSFKNTDMTLNKTVVTHRLCYVEIDSVFKSISVIFFLCQIQRRFNLIPAEVSFCRPAVPKLGVETHLVVTRLI